MDGLKMKILEFRGPFRSGEEIARIPADVNTEYVQIGVQIPECLPIDLKQRLAPDIEINNVGYCVHERWIVEFTDINVQSFTIVARRALPAECIIDVLSDTRQE